MLFHGPPKDSLSRSLRNIRRPGGKDVRRLSSLRNRNLLRQRERTTIDAAMRMAVNMRRKLPWPIFLFLLAAFHAGQVLHGAIASDAKAFQAETRMDLIREQQRVKSRNLQPSKPGKTERILVRFVGKNPMNKYAGGIPGMHLRIGGLPGGAGFGLGPEYARPDLAGGQVFFRAAAVASVKQWYRIDAELQLSSLAQRYLDLGFQGRRLDLNSIDYYGPGPDSQKSGRTNYRREESAFDISLAFKPTQRYLSIGFIAGYQWLNVGPGQSPDRSSSEKLHLSSAAPGIDKQTNYLRVSSSMQADSRDKPGDPHRGAHLLLKFSRYSDRKHGRFSFRQIDGLAEQYIPFYNSKRVIVLRARSVLTYPDGDQTVPFYMQPTLGGDSDLRGYQRYRFRDNNTFVINSEYFWEVFTLMDAAVFADVGKVFQRDGDFDLDNLQSNAGFGFRFKSRRAVVLRIDTAFSHEGFGLWLAFNHAF